MIPFRTPFFVPFFYPSLLWRVPTREKEIYLTFDDGPVYGPTEFVLEQLKKATAKATFFCIGDNVKKHPELFQKILREKHTIGNHTFNHLNGWKTKDDIYLENVQQCVDEFTKHNMSTVFFRPPYGQIKKQQIKPLSNYKIVMWDVLSWDFDKNTSPEKCLRGSIASTRKGSIIVFHDSIKASRNLEYVLPRYLDHFTGLGYSFKAL